MSFLSIPFIPFLVFAIVALIILRIVLKVAKTFISIGIVLIAALILIVTFSHYIAPAL